MTGNSTGRLHDKIILITGAASGLGAAQTAHLSDEGATVVATDLAFDAEEKTGRIIRRSLDVRREEDWHETAAWLHERFGRVDGLVNNAGISSRDGLLDVSIVDWENTFRVNVTGALIGIQSLVPCMPSGSSIVNISSWAGLTALRTTAYTSSKWALRGLSRVASLELGPQGIRVNTIFPGSIDTPLTRSSAKEFRAAMINEIPLGRQGTGDDLAPMVAFLLSDESSWITGAEISVDGGEWSHGGAKAISDVARDAQRREASTSDMFPSPCQNVEPPQ